MVGIDVELEPGQVVQLTLPSPHTNSYVVIPFGGVMVVVKVVTPVVALKFVPVNVVGVPPLVLI